MAPVSESVITKGPGVSTSSLVLTAQVTDLKT